jgi:hypothetical protein
LVPLPVAKFKSGSGLTRREEASSCSIWDEQINEKIGKEKDSVMVYFIFYLFLFKF